MPVGMLERTLIHALQINPRAPFRQLAQVLGISQQTAARRYRALRDAGVLRVVGMVHPRRLGLVQWFVRLRCTPDAAQAVAMALARRRDTSWVQLTSGGTEIVCLTHSAAMDAPNALLLRELPRTPRVVSVTAHCLLRTFVGGPVGWPGLAGTLTVEQVAALRPQPVEGPPDGPADLTDDGPLLDALAQDGRMSYTDLGRAVGRPEPVVRRRVSELRRHGALYFDIDVDQNALGFHAQALLWLSVRPGAVERVAETLAGHPENAFVGATTGPTNLLANIVCPDVEALHGYLTQRVGALEAVDRIETAPIIRTVKRAATPVFRMS
ncbi:MAG: Lrp/AsnC family transcriptional regulator [Pseudonocardia sp.]